MKDIRVKRNLLSLLILVSPTLGIAQENRIHQGQEIATALVRSERLPGLSVAVSVDDSILWSEGFGYADVESRTRVTPKTRFRIGSVAKLFTAVAAARLHERNLLDLDAPVQEYVRDFPNKRGILTTRQLLGHLSGIRHYGRNEYFNRTAYPNVRRALTIFRDDSLIFTPGSRYSYSSYGYVLASAVIEVASGKDFLTYLKDEVFDPLRLTSIRPDRNDPSQMQATPYSLDTSNAWATGSSIDNSDRWGAGGFLSNAEDLVRFGSKLLGGRFLNADTRKVLFTSQATSDGRETGVGLGWRIDKDSLGNVYYHHGGQSIGGRAFLLVSPKSGVVVALLSNLSFARFGENEALELAEIFSE